MPVDYSKWDALELSDDSDIEVHPNVDKKSFIRAKQNQIHETRFRRRHQIETLKYERTINEGLLSRIDRLLVALKSHHDDTRKADELVFQSLIESSSASPEDDQPPPRPEGVHSQVNDEPTYSKMMATLVDQVKKEVDEKGSEDRYRNYVKAIEGHQSKVQQLQKELHLKLAELEKEESSKITSDSIHTGFDSSFVSKNKDPPKQNSGGEKVKSVEVLNPGVLNRTDSISSGAEADVEEDVTAESEEHIEPSKLGKEFAKIKYGDYRSSMHFISSNPSVVAERETDGLLVTAFNSQLEGKDDFARQCVHQALLLQYCRSLGPDGVSLFFKRITTPGHQAQKVFVEDVTSTYGRIRTRAAEINKERAENPSKTADVEQIQLHAVDPGTQINIKIPPKESDNEQEKAARAIFESFPPNLRKGLESGSLDKVNEVLGKMSVDEAEEIVGQLGEGGMLSLEEQIIDATTEEGQSALRELEAYEKAKAAENQRTPDPE